MKLPGEESAPGIPWYFRRGSSDLDWCEPNYVVSKSIAEFYNTISNALFALYPPILYCLFRQYARHMSRWCHLVWTLLVAVGVGSAYFHATLSLSGQLMDEFAILWVFNACLAIWIPQKYLAASLRNRPWAFPLLMLLVTLLGTTLGCIVPVINCLVLMVCTVPTAVILYKETKWCVDERAARLGTRSLIMWAVAVSIWVSDRVLCGLWLRLGIPYLHSVWHVLVTVCSCQCIVFMALRAAETTHPARTPRLSFWPADHMTWVGIPYVSFREQDIGKNRKETLPVTVVPLRMLKG